MSQSRTSQSPASSSRVPTYLTDAPRLSRLSQSSTQSPRISASSNRHGLKPGSAFETFDAPTYCTDMAAYIAEQLSLKSQKGKLREKAVGSVIEDKWRGPASQREQAVLADVSVQTTTSEDDADGVDAKSDDIDASRTEQKLQAAEAFLQQVKSHSEEVTEAERGLEEQVLSFFGADIADQCSEKDELESSNDIQPEVAAHVAGMLVDKEKVVKNPALLIEEVGASDEEVDSEDDDESSDEEEEEIIDEEDDMMEEEDTSEEDSQDGENGRIRPTLFEGEAIISNQSKSYINEVDEEDDDLEEGASLEEGESEDELQDNDTNGFQLYADDMRSQSSFPLNETIELLDSDDEEEENNDAEEDQVDDVDQESNDNMAEQLEIERPEQINSFSNMPVEVEEASNLNLFEQAAAVAIADAWDSINERNTNGSTDAHIDLETQMSSQDQSVSQVEPADLYTESNLFEQPISAFADFSTVTATYPPHITLSESQSPRPNSTQAHVSFDPTTMGFKAIESLTSPLPSDQESHDIQAPPVLHHLLGTSSGADLLSMKGLGQDDRDTSRAVSVAVQPGTPQRAMSADYSRDTNDGTARHARDLFNIKSVAQNVLDRSTSLATSMASDLHSAPHHSDVDTLDPAQKEHSEEQAVGTNDRITFDEDIAKADSYVDQESINTREAEKELKKETKKTEEIELDVLEEEVVGIVEHEESEAETERLSFSQEIDVQSLKEGSVVPQHIFGQEEESEGDGQHSLAHIEETSGPLEVIEEIDDVVIGAEEQGSSASNDVEKLEEEAISISTNTEKLEEEDVSISKDVDKVLQAEKIEDHSINIQAEVVQVQVPEASANASPPAETDAPQPQSEVVAPSLEVSPTDHIIPNEDETVENVEQIADQGNANTGEGGKESELGNTAKEKRLEESETPMKAKVKRTRRSRVPTTESTSPVITRRSLRRSTSRAASELASEDKSDAEVSEEDNKSTIVVTPKRGKRSRTSTKEHSSPVITKGSLRKTASRALSEAASEDTPGKKRHHRHKSDAGGDLADCVPDEVVEEEESERPTKRSKSVAKDNVDVDEEAEVEDEEMLDISILEEDETQMDIDGEGATEEEKEDPALEKQQVEVISKTPRSRRRSAPRKSNDGNFRPRKAEDSDSEEDEDAKARKMKKEKQQRKRREEEREQRKEQREVKRLEKEAQQKEEKEAERAAVGLVRKSRISQDVKAFRPNDAAQEEEEEKDTIAKRRSKRRVFRAPL